MQWTVKDGGKCLSEHAFCERFCPQTPVACQTWLIQNERRTITFTLRAFTDTPAPHGCYAALALQPFAPAFPPPRTADPTAMHTLRVFYMPGPVETYIYDIY